MTETRQRLRNLADDCEERARRSNNADARSRYHRAASDARRDAAAPYMGEEGLRRAFEAALAQAHFAAWCAGEGDEAFAQPGLRQREPGPEIDPPLDNCQAHVTAGALNARQLASLSGMTERGARKAIERGVRKRLPGFYRDGRNWYAERRAFQQFRMSSEQIARGSLSP